MTFIILLTHWADMTFHIKDVLYIGGIIFSAAIAYGTIKSNKKRIEKLEKKTENLKEIFTNFKVQMAEMKFEIIEAVQKIFNGKKK